MSGLASAERQIPGLHHCSVRFMAQDKSHQVWHRPDQALGPALVSFPGVRLFLWISVFHGASADPFVWILDWDGWKPDVYEAPAICSTWFGVLQNFLDISLPF